MPVSKSNVKKGGVSDGDNLRNVVFVINQYSSDLSTGFGGRSYSLASNLTNVFKDVYLICAKHHHLNHKSHDIEPDLTKKFNIVPLSLIKNASAHSLWRKINWFIFAAKIGIIDRHIGIRPSAIIYSSPSLIGFIGAYFLAKRSKARIILDVRDIWPLSVIELGKKSRFHSGIILLTLIEKFAYERSDAIISPLQGLNDHVIKIIGRPVKKFSYIPTPYLEVSASSAISETEKKLKKISNENFVVGYCGTFGLSNSIDNLINAARLLKDRADIQFVLVGDGNYKKRNVDFVSRLGLTNVTILPGVTKHRVPKVLGNFDVGYIGWRDLDLYKYGTGPNKLAEYLRHGVPVLHSYSGHYDLVSVNKVGKTVIAECPHELAEAIIEMKELDKAQFEELQRNCTKLFNQKFNAEYTSAKLIDLLTAS